VKDLGAVVVELRIANLVVRVVGRGLRVDMVLGQGMIVAVVGDMTM
jgi:hypothetical protein